MHPVWVSGIHVWCAYATQPPGGSGIRHGIPNNQTVHLAVTVPHRDSIGLSPAWCPGVRIPGSTQHHHGIVPSCKGMIRLSDGSKTTHREKGDRQE